MEKEIRLEYTPLHMFILMLNINNNNKYLDYPDQEVPRVWNDKVPKGSYER